MLIHGHPGRTNYIFVFKQSCVRSAVGINQTVKTKVAVMREFTRIAAVAVDIAIIGSFSVIYRMVTPFPYKSAAKVIVFHSKTIIIFNVTRTVAHCVTVFTDYKRLARRCAVNIVIFPMISLFIVVYKNIKTASVTAVVFDLRDGGIHAADGVEI